MITEVKPAETEALAEARRRHAKRRREILYRFVDQFTNASVEITPRMQRAIDTYRRNKGLDVVETGEASQSDE